MGELVLDLRDPRFWTGPEVLVREAIANSLFPLLAHPEQAALLRSEPGRVCTAVEECLRPVPAVPRGLARVEVQEAVLAFVERFPRAELRTREPERIPFTMDEKLAALRVATRE